MMHIVRDAIESILMQTYRNFELIITDDCSTDKSGDIIDEYDRLDKRIKVIKNKDNIGLTKSLNNMIDIAKGEFIARMDGDDICVKNRFEEQIKIFKKHNVDIIFSDTILIDYQGNYICQSWRPKSLENILNLISLNNFIPHPTIMIRKKIFSKFGKYNNKFKTGQDTELWTRLAKSGVKFYYLNKNLLYYRINPDSVRNKLSNNSCYKNQYYRLANICIWNNNKRRALKYFRYLDFKQKAILIIKLLIPFQILFWKGLIFKRYFTKRN